MRFAMVVRLALGRCVAVLPEAFDDRRQIAGTDGARARFHLATTAFDMRQIVSRVIGR
jgi:hypothetical protein